jgi:hypothetical protein
MTEAQCVVDAVAAVLSDFTEIGQVQVAPDPTQNTLTANMYDRKEQVAILISKEDTRAGGELNPDRKKMLNYGDLGFKFENGTFSMIVDDMDEPSMSSTIGTNIIEDITAAYSAIEGLKIAQTAAPGITTGAVQPMTDEELGEGWGVEAELDEDDLARMNIYLQA